MGHDSQHHHIIPLKVYLNVLGALLVLTALTVMIAQVDFGSWNTVIAMLIASVKAFLVLSIFMHLKYDNKIYAVAFGTAVFFLIVLYFFSELDIFTRHIINPVL